MHVSDLQQTIAAFVNRNDLQAPVAHRLLDLTSEVGELSKEMLKSSAYGRQPFRKADAWEQELGDVFFSLLCLANSSGVDLESAIHNTLTAYAQRIQDRGTPSSGA